MSSPYVGEIRMFGGNFAPAGWMLCQGQTLPISENETLFNLIGTTYGGDGQKTFNLPDLQGRLPVHMGSGPGGQTFIIGEKAGVETVTLTQQQIPNHNHSLNATGSSLQLSPLNAVPAVAFSNQAGVMVYGTDTAALSTLQQNTIQAAGGNQPHDNVQPFLCVNFIISLFGIFPSPT
jgi:microcystin-dependent protein